MLWLKFHLSYQSLNFSLLPVKNIALNCLSTPFTIWNSGLGGRALRLYGKPWRSNPYLTPHGKPWKFYPYLRPYGKPWRSNPYLRPYGKPWRSYPYTLDREDPTRTLDRTVKPWRSYPYLWRRWPPRGASYRRAPRTVGRWSGTRWAAGTESDRQWRTRPPGGSWCRASLSGLSSVVWRWGIGRGLTPWMMVCGTGCS